MAKEIILPETHTLQGITESFRCSLDGLRRERANKYNINSGSFILKEDNCADSSTHGAKKGAYTYAYRDCVWEETPKYFFYHLISSNDENIVAFLDYWDRLEEKQNRHGGAVSSYEQQNHLRWQAEEGEDDAGTDPEGKQLYLEWMRETDASEGKKLPLPAEYGVIHSLLERLTPADRRVYEYMFAGNMTDEETKQELTLEHSTWSMEKRRFLDKVREAFVSLGYDVPTQAELDKERKLRNDHMKLIDEQKAKEKKEKDLGRSIAREHALMEQTDRPRAFVDKDERLQEDIEEMLEDDRIELAEERISCVR